METQLLDISKIRKNPDNPRLIKDDKFKKLVQSVKDFPQMMDIRPVVVNKEMMILGGNMRYEAAKSAGWKQVPVIIADNLTEEQEREFIIKDNIQSGEWDFDLLANGWDETLLQEWGLDLPIDNLPKEDKKEDNETECPKCGYKF